MTALRWGILSTARIGGAILDAAARTRAAEVVAVASRDARRAEAFAASHGISRAHGSYAALLADPGVDAVYVPLPNALHAEWSIRALEVGRHVLCEKPLTRHAADAARAFAVARRAGRVLEEAFMWRHHPQARRLRELLDAGAVGRLRHVRASFHFTLADAADIRLRGDLEGGALMDLGCYCLSAIRLVTGAEPERVWAEQVRGGAGVDVAFAALLRFPDNVTAALDCSLVAPAGHGLEVVGSTGTLALADPWHARGECVIELRRSDGVQERILAGPASPYELELEHFAALVRGERPPCNGRDFAVAQARALEALHRSAEEGRPVALADVAT